MPEDWLVKVGPVADCTDVDQSTVYRWVRQGRLPAIRIGRTIRIRASAVERIFGITPPRPGPRRKVSA